MQYFKQFKAQIYCETAKVLIIQAERSRANSDMEQANRCAQNVQNQQFTLGLLHTIFKANRRSPAARPEHREALQQHRSLCAKNQQHSRAALLKTDYWAFRSLGRSQLTSKENMAQNLGDFFIFLFFNFVFYKNIFLFSKFTGIYPGRPAVGRQGFSSKNFAENLRPGP